MPNREKLIRVALITLAFLVFGGALFVAWRNFSTQKSSQEKPILKSSGDVFEQEADSVDDMLVTREAVGTEVADTALKSENYQVEQIRFGGEAAVAFGDSENQPIEISDVKTETFTNSKGDESRASITWRSNKLTVAEIEYSKSAEKNAKVVSGNDFSFGHSMVIPGIDPGTAYVYRIKSRDHWGNEVASDYYGFYTSAKATSVFELITQKMKDIFGWAIK